MPVIPLLLREELWKSLAQASLLPQIVMASIKYAAQAVAAVSLFYSQVNNYQLAVITGIHAYLGNKS